MRKYTTRTPLLSVSCGTAGGTKTRTSSPRTAGGESEAAVTHFLASLGLLHQEWRHQDNSAAMQEAVSACSPNQPTLGKLKRNMMPQTSEKKRQVHLAKTKRRCHERVALPVRLTSCILKRPVTRITSHPDNEVRYNERERTLEKPQQICAYRRLQGLQACSSEGETLSTLDFINIAQIISLGNAAAGSPLSSSEPSMVPSSARAGMIPGVDLCLLPSICREPVVTPGDIRRQTWRVKDARKRLAEALREDRLAREVERARSQEGHSDN
ncbi:methyl-CpG-binding domain protein 3-like 2B isoform X2 [Canis lupus familiaris]|uniref:methyl-CpG-binding domain protein 3-like 2B isoform X2 n=1 Tax=Canis lupus familiaris TaxID=9615 RepID=UPI0018F344B4|nr:methyl-CpG-binding domain protein 3-like 2B isoform X2 [Canis lupus familiaris]XP_038423454.1 methyl-CpG-binding domain protein 3-like 2B isoform X2 [Canis lupus familiaris]